MKKLIFLLIVLLSFTINSCHSEKKHSENLNTRGNNTGTINNIKTAKIKFTVHTPGGVPSNKLFLVILPFFDYQILKRVELQSTGYNTYSAIISLPIGGFIRYAYDQFDPGTSSWSDLYNLREKFSNKIIINYRVVWINKKIIANGVNDTIATWENSNSTIDRGTISGKVLDETTSMPITDATVAIAGVFTPTSFEGKFKLEKVPVGQQRVTVFTTLGDYKYYATYVTVEKNKVSNLLIKLHRARKVHVIFKATTADEMLTSNLYLVGNIFQLGSMYGPFPNWGFTPWEAPRYIVMRKISDYTYQAEFDLYAGTYIRYLYTLAGQYYGEEWKDHNPIYREYIIPETDTVILKDKLEPFFTKNMKKISLTIIPPTNTPTKERLYLNIGGPSIPLSYMKDGKWGITFPMLPGELHFYVYHGFDEMGEKEPQMALLTTHTLNATTDTQPKISITQWRYAPPAPIDNSIYYDAYVTVSIPPSTPSNISVFLLETDASGNSLATTIPTIREQLNPTMTSIKIQGLSKNSFYFKVCSETTSNCYSQIFSIAPRFSGEAFYLSVPYWHTRPLIKKNFISILYPVDYWRPAFLNLIPTTYQRIKKDNAKYVVITSVWAYGQIFPYPTLEQRPIITDNPFTPKEELEKAVKIAHSMGLKVMIYSQMNAENHPDWNKFLSTPLSDQWWEQWFKCARDLYMYHAWLAEKTGAEMLLLPGPFFHVFPQDKNFADPNYITTFDSKMESLIQEVRTIYHGKIIVNGRAYSSNNNSQPQFYNFPSKADYTIITTFDMEPSLGVGNNATLEEIKNVLESRVQQYIVPMYDRYQKPVIINFSYPSVDGAADGNKGVSFNIPDDPSIKLDLGEQAILYEAILEIVEEKSYIGGFMDFGFLHSYAPLNKDYSIRDKPAEAVVRKFYGRW